MIKCQNNSNMCMIPCVYLPGTDTEQHALKFDQMAAKPPQLSMTQISELNKKTLYLPSKNSSQPIKRRVVSPHATPTLAKN